MRTKTLFVTLAMLMAILLTACGGAALAQTPEAADDSPPLRTLTVTGNGRAFLSPDIANISIGVHTENEDAAKAVASNNQQTQQVMDALGSFDIAPEDMQTTNFSIFPRQEYDNEGNLQGTTFVVDNTVFVTLRDIEQVGEVLDAAVQAGANSISGIQFDVQDRTEALSEARQAAVADAQQQAEELAQAAGVELGDIQSINTSNSPAPLPQPRVAMQAEGVGGSVPVSPGQLTLTVDVNIVYQIQ